MKKAQVSVAYLGLIVLISMFIFGLTFVFSNNLKDDTAIQFNEQHARSILTYIEHKLVRMKTLAEPDPTTFADVEITVEVPVNIGDEKYFIRGEGNDLVLNLPGKGFAVGRQTIFRKNMYWWNKTFEGGAFSANGEITFTYNSSSKDVTIS